MRKHLIILATAFIVAFLLFMFAGHKLRIKQAEAHELDGWTILNSLIISPTPSPEPVTLPPGVVEIIRFNFKDLGEQVTQQAIRIFNCESGLRPNAINTKNRNGSIDIGLAQINSVHGVPGRLLTDPRINIAIARKIYNDRGNWSAWACAKRLGIRG